MGSIESITGHRWEFYDESLREWRPVAEAWAEVVEQKFAERASTCRVMLGRYVYLVDLTALTQINEQTQRRRQIRRRMLFADRIGRRMHDAVRIHDAIISRQGARNEQERQRAEEAERQLSEQTRAAGIEMLSAFPDVATLSTASLQRRSRFSLRRNPSTDRRVIEKPVPADRPVYSVLSELFTRSMTRHREGIGSTVWCEPPQVEISSIWETINPSLLDKYQLARRDMAVRRPNGCSPLQGVSATKCVVDEGHVNLNEYGDAF